jgi:hypothetical protein
MKINSNLVAADLATTALRVLDIAGQKAQILDRAWAPARGAPVFTAKGQYTARGWTEWTQGFQHGLAILAFDGTGQSELLKLGRSRTLERMGSHVSHIGVHDHAFNNLSTYGNLRRLMREARIPYNSWEMAFYDMALKTSASVQAARWATTSDGRGYIYSFNGPHSLFIDTMRTLRILGLAHQMGHVLMGENDQAISLLQRLIQHGMTTAQYNVFYGEGRDCFDVPEACGRTAHEAIFNRNDGRFRCPNTQQGYSPFTTWTRGLAWGLLGFAEELEFLCSLDEQQFEDAGFRKKEKVIEAFSRAAQAAADYYIHRATAADGIPYWDTGAPGLHSLGDWTARDADPFNEYEPVDSSAAAIAAQGLLRLGTYLGAQSEKGATYLSAGLTAAKTLFGTPYLAQSHDHQGLLLHSVYHRPNGWDYISPRYKIPCGESSMWGDYHLAELAVLVERMASRNQPYYCFFDAAKER